MELISSVSLETNISPSIADHAGPTVPLQPSLTDSTFKIKVNSPNMLFLHKLLSTVMLEDHAMAVIYSVPMNSVTKLEYPKKPANNTWLKILLNLTALPCNNAWIVHPLLRPILLFQIVGLLPNTRNITFLSMVRSAELIR